MEERAEQLTEALRPIITCLNADALVPVALIKEAEKALADPAPSEEKPNAD